MERCRGPPFALREGKLFYTWDLLDDVDGLYVKRNRLVGMNYLGIIVSVRMAPIKHVKAMQ